MLGERTSRNGAIGIGLSFCGIALLVVGDPEFGLNFDGSLLGDLLIGGAVVSAALYMVYARDLGRSYSSLEITFVQIVYGRSLLQPVFSMGAASPSNGRPSRLKSALAVGYLTVFATVGAFLCYNFALSQVPASKAAVFVNGIPVVTAIGAWVLLDERLTGHPGRWRRAGPGRGFSDQSACPQKRFPERPPGRSFARLHRNEAPVGFRQARRLIVFRPHLFHDPLTPQPFSGVHLSPLSIMSAK